ncbi:MAG: hypothetical protein IPL61_13425 [Myxococcales bacterium]|nr:hypothetical protein [Myxococcales bacterium]
MRAWLSCLLLAIACGGHPPGRSAPVAPAPVAPAPVAPDVAGPEPTPPEPTPPGPRPGELPDAPPWTAPAAPLHVLAVLPQVPAGARYVLGADVARLARGAAGGALRELLAIIIGASPPACRSITTAQFAQVVIAGVGLQGEQVYFLGPALTERATAPCLTATLLGKDGATIEHKPLSGRTVYYADGAGAVDDVVAWSKISGPIYASREDWLAAALDPRAPKATPDLVALAATADHARMVWLAALVAPADLAPLGLPDGLLAGPVAVRAGLDLGDELELDVDVTFATADAAARFGDLVRLQVPALRADPDTAPLVTDVRLGIHGAELRLIVHVDRDATAALIARLHTP